MAAVKKVKIVPKKQIDAAANLLYQMANALSDVGYQRALAQQQSNRGERIVSNIDADFSGINEQMEKAVESMQALSESFASIKTSAASSAKAVESTDSIIKTIENASTQLTLIGFNASIEAKRAGAAGAGFNVIAQEVRTLADKNTKQAGEIETTLNGIKKAMKDINSQIKAVYSHIEKNQEVIESLKEKLGDVSKMVSEI